MIEKKIDNKYYPETDSFKILVDNKTINMTIGSFKHDINYQNFIMDLAYDLAMDYHNSVRNRL